MIGIIYIGQIELAPFVKKYVSVFEQEGADYEIVHWNRSGIKMPDDDKNITFSMQLNRYCGLVKKLVPFLKFRNYVKSVLKQKKYDKLVVLTTQTAVMIPDVLFGKYKHRYFFDYRDTSYEYIKPYSAFINRVILNSCCTAVSSPGFKEYLTNKKELVVAHNFQEAYYKERALECRKNTSEKIVMGYIGYIREYDYLVKVAEQFGKDKRFEFRIHGSGDTVDELREFAKKFDNVTVYGAYDEKDKMSIIDTFDMICYNYPKSFVNYPAVANKFYDGLIRKKPMFANADTFSGKLVAKSEVGISLPENDDNITSKVYEYYASLDEKRFDEACEKLLSRVIEEDKYYIEKIRDFALERR